MKKPEVIICPAGCGYIRVYRKQKRCVGCGIKLFYIGDIINPSDDNDMNGFIWFESKWVNVKLWLNKFLKKEGFNMKDSEQIDIEIEKNVDLKKNLIERRMVELTPILANHYLGFNTYDKQRFIRKPHVAELAEKMINGLFRFGEIGFVSKKGNKDILVNGQHVCHAVIKSGITVPCMLERFSVENDRQLSEIFRQFEILPKSLRDMVAIEAAALKIIWPVKISSLIVTAAIIEAAGQKDLRWPTGMSVQTQKEWMSRDDKVKLLGKYMKEGAFIADIFMSNGIQKTLTGSEHLKRAAVVYIMMKTWRINQNDAEIFWMRVRDGEGLNKSMPEMKIRNFLFLTRLAVRTSAYVARSASPHEYAYRCALAWNSFRSGHSTKLAYHSGRPIPKLK